MLNLLSPTGSDVLGHFESRLGLDDNGTCSRVLCPGCPRNLVQECNVGTVQSGCYFQGKGKEVIKMQGFITSV